MGLDSTLTQWGGGGRDSTEMVNFKQKGKNSCLDINKFRSQSNKRKDRLLVRSPVC